MRDPHLVPPAAQPMAIIGMAFRFPGDLSTPDALWRALVDGADLVTEVDAGRWAVDRLRHPRRVEPGRSVTFSAGVLSDIDAFDAAFFGISPREATMLDPQQRLLLELAWEALENATLAPSRLAGSDTAVYVGISGLDYGMRMLDDLAGMSAHSMTGNTMSVAANRLSYVFDLRGPSMAIDTACSSSLVALHEACACLERGDASMALVGGVNLLLHPYPFIGFTKASMLSANGRCRAFDADGDGYVRSEGAAVLVIKPLADAERDGDPVEAVILATGVNADGARKAGLTIPSREGQVELMRRVLRRADIAAERIDHLEAHGTGTPVGDPIECAAIGEVYGRGRRTPLPIGSVKTNLGHLEAAAGMAGLVKTVLMLRHRALVPSRNLERPNPTIDFEALNLNPVRAHAPLPGALERRPVMGVNSFGFGGANAHVLLQGVERRRRTERGPVPRAAPLLLSAATPAALRDLALRYADRIAGAPDAYYDVAWSAAHHRDRLACRLGVSAAEPHVVEEALRRHAAGAQRVAGVTEDPQAPVGGSVAFVYAGNGAQWAGMGRRLLAEDRRFAAHMAALDARMSRVVGFSVLETLAGDPAQVRLDDTSVAQPLLFAMQVAITRWLADEGVEPAAVTGHSVGEVAAAWAAGALTLDDAIRVIHVRSRAQATTRGSGRMAAVALSEADALREVEAVGGAGLEVAGINGPSDVTLAGPLAELQRLGESVRARGVFFRLLDLDYAFHSRAMDGLLALLEEGLQGLAPGATRIPFVSTVSGDVLEGCALGAAYWWANVRQPVQFERAVAALQRLDTSVFVEITPNGILQRYLAACLRRVPAGAEPGAGPGAGSGAGPRANGSRVLGTLRREEDGPERLAETAMRIRLALSGPCLGTGFPVPGRRVHLPTYPWQRERHWAPVTEEAAHVFGAPTLHPLLGRAAGDGTQAWEHVVDLATHPSLADHRVGHDVVFPAAGFAELALAAARASGAAQVEIDGLDILAPLVIDADHGRAVRVEVADGVMTIRSRPRLSSEAWQRHATARIVHPGAAIPASGFGVSAPAVAGDDGPIALDAETLYARCAALGLHYGPSFRAFVRGLVVGDEVQGELDLPEDDPRVVLPPAALDACFQSLVALLHGFAAEAAASGVDPVPRPMLPVRIGRLLIAGAVRPVRFRARLLRLHRRSALARFELFDAAGACVAVADGCRFRVAPLQGLAAVRPDWWRMVRWPKPHAHDRTSGVAASVAELAEVVRDGMAARSDAARWQRWCDEGAPLFDALVAAFAHAAVGEVVAHDPGWVARVRSGADDLPEDRRAYARWLVRLLDDAALLPTGASAAQTAESPPPAAIWRELLAEFPDALPELAVVGHVGAKLAAFLRGNLDGAALVDAALGTPQAAAIDEDAPACRAANDAVDALLRHVARALPPHRRLAILEIGPGHAQHFQHLAADLPADQVDVVVCADDAAGVARLKSELTGTHATAALLDPRTLALDAGTDLPERFDVVIVRHRLHAGPGLRAWMSATRARLADDGLLVLLERPPEAAVDFVRGLDPAWWHPDAGGAPSSSLLPPGVWLALLREHGFADAQAVFGVQAEAGSPTGGAMMLLARAPKAATDERAPSQASWLLVSGPAGEARELAERLAPRLLSVGQRVRVSTLANGAQGFAAAVVEASGEGQRVDHVVYLADGTPASGEVHPGHCIDQVAALSAAVRALPSGSAVPRLWCVVRSGGAARLADAGDADPVAAAIVGACRVVMNERPDLRCTVIEAATEAADAHGVDRVLAELVAPDGESEVVLAPHARLARRLTRIEMPRPAAPRGKPEAERFRLDFGHAGGLRQLAWTALPERAPGEEDVEVRPLAAGLNFRDVMYAMGLLPDEAVEDGFAGASLGLEFSGVVERVGARVTDFRPGDAVMGFGSACFASHVVTRASAVALKPAGWSHAEAATVPTAFLTAIYALRHLADLQPGERVLVHGAAGGVGIAAVQIARLVGAEVFCTAGSDEKRAFVQLLGADHVLDSRSLAFADRVLALTGGEGVDVVLNSLAGEAIVQSLRTLRPFGRFIELGKRDFFENTRIALRPLRNNISYFGVDADQLLVRRARLAVRLFRELMDGFTDGALTPLPYRLFAASQVVEAFRHVQQSRHIGKVVIDLSGARVAPDLAPPLAAPVFGDDAAYLVTGGLEGFGLETACWLAAHGARHLVLMGRRGLRTPGAETAVARIAAAGARAYVIACDVTDRAALESALVRTARELPPLRGVFHAAMVIDDGLLQQVEASRIARVMAPKVAGAWHLHTLTRHLALDHFVLFGSITTALGNPGQGAYVAGNAFLEALAALRRASGLPGTCLSWAALAESGYLARNVAVRDALAARTGDAGLSNDAALAALGMALVADAPGGIVGTMNWRALCRVLPSADNRRFALLRRAQAEGGAAADEGDVRERLRGLSRDEALAAVKEWVATEVAATFSTSPDRIDPTRPLRDQGMDSLMAVELALGIERRFSVPLSAMALGDDASVATIAELVLARLNGGADAAGAAAAGDATGGALPDVVARLAERHGAELSAEELAGTVAEMQGGRDADLDVDTPVPAGGRP